MRSASHEAARQRCWGVRLPASEMEELVHAVLPLLAGVLLSQVLRLTSEGPVGTGRLRPSVLGRALPTLALRTFGVLSAQPGGAEAERASVLERFSSWAIRPAAGLACECAD
mmetsp:Transcript_90916/g.294207  ORF Transcript_90916/g.294207 Transcript_90916/m.294207 type:complete len:112 (+) Transcript_90916:1028-1363(+)